jgi:hypothetical protein
MRAITVSDGDQRIRVNGDQITDVTERNGVVTLWIALHGPDRDMPYSVDLRGEQASAFLEWWDGEARRGGGYIGGNDPQTATNDGTDWVPSVNERVSLVAHDPFAAPDEYMGVVVHHGSFGGTLVVRVAWDNGKESDLPYRALRKAD